MDEVFRVVIPGQYFECQMEAGPGPPGAGPGILAGHPGGEMLEVPDGVPDKEVFLAMLKKPDEGCIRSRGGDDHRGFIELKNSLGWFSLDPQ